MDDNGTQVNDCPLSEPISSRNLPRSNEEALYVLAPPPACRPITFPLLRGNSFSRGTRVYATPLRRYDLKRLRRRGDKEESRNGTSISLNEFNTRGSRSTAR